MLLPRQNMLDHDLVITMTNARSRTLIIRYKFTSDYRANFFCRSLSGSRASIPPVLSTTGKGRALTVDDEPHITHSYSLCLVEMRLFEVDTYDDILETL
jgi:hypothetical protein